VPAAPVTERPAADKSPLANLRQRREAIAAELHVDLKVPRWEDDGGPSIFVRYKAATPGKVEGAREKRRKQRKALGDDWIVYANADILIDACVGVFALADDGKTELSLRDGDPYGEMTTFDPDLGFSLGLEDEGAVAVVRKLYFTDFDLTSACNDLCAWSGVRINDSEEAFLGN
jgi:hypothetical protein